MSIPNILTISRIVAIPVIIALLLIDNSTMRIAALLLYIAAAITDWLDGYLARKLNDLSGLGRMLDPIADKLLVGALLIFFAHDSTFAALDMIAAILIMVRELFISGLREFMGNQNIVVHVSKLAKYKTTVQLIALGLYFVTPILPTLYPITLILFWVAAALTLWTGWGYFVGALPHLMEDK